MKTPHRLVNFLVMDSKHAIMRGRYDNDDAAHKRERALNRQDAAVRGVDISARYYVQIECKDAIKDESIYNKA